MKRVLAIVLVLTFVSACGSQEPLSGYERDKLREKRITSESGWYTYDRIAYEKGLSNVTSNDFDSQFPCIEIDWKDALHLVWVENKDGGGDIWLNKCSNVCYMKLIGTSHDIHWASYSNRLVTGQNSYNVSNNSGLSISPMLKIDTNNQPHIVWVDSSFDSRIDGYNEVMYVSFSRKRWRTINRDIYNPTTGNSALISSSWKPSFDIDIKGNLYFNCLSEEGTSFYKWINSDLSPIGGNYVDFLDQKVPLPLGMNDSLDYKLIAKNDIVHLFQDPHQKSGISYVFCSNEGFYKIDGEVCENVDDSIINGSVSEYPSSFACAIDSKNNPHILMYAKDKKNHCYLSYIKWNGNEWVRVDGSKYTGKDDKTNIPIFWNQLSATIEMKLDKNDNPHIAWIDKFSDSAEVINYITWKDSNWVTLKGEKFDHTANQTQLTEGIVSGISLALNSDNIPYIAWSEKVDGKWDIFCVRGSKDY
ncbi:MAG TPA: hypothetical protein P5106_08610 [Caldisericia bacterium]|nr:hypothetical protein [Caldisericia bacterium]